MRAAGIVIIQYICDIIPYPMDRLKQLSLSVEPINANLFKHVQMAPPDPILGTAVAFQKDTSKDKINLGIGAYRDGDGKPYVFKAVQEAEQIISKGNFNKVILSPLRSTYPSRVQLPSAPAPGDCCWETAQQSRRGELPPLNRFLERAPYTLGSSS